MMPVGRAIGVLVVAVTLFAVSPGAQAQPAVTGLQVSTTPALPSAANASGATVRAVASGSSVALRVLATYSDGTTRDVTSDPATSYQSLAPGVATVSTSGGLTFAPGSQSDAAAILVEHGGTSALVAFDVVP